jgi:pimeloyl-ACP methyl ester carboxylesterase
MTRTCILRSLKDINLNDFNVTTETPDCICLSNNKTSKFEIDISNISQDIIQRASNEYAQANHKLTSDFRVDMFTDRNDNSHRFCCTKLTKPRNKKTAIYLAGNNDYFYDARTAYKLVNAGYNFYAISFPGFGFASDVNSDDHSTFGSIDSLFIYIDVILEYYHARKIDVLIAHSLGALISIMYANARPGIVQRLILSSPLLKIPVDPSDYYARILSNILTAKFGFIFPRVNLQSRIGTPNYTSICDFNELNFNPRYKNLYCPHVYPDFIRTILLTLDLIYAGKVDVRCKVTILRSDKSSSPDEFTYKEDNVLDVNDINKYSSMISSKPVTMHEIPGSIHSCFLRVDILDYL